MIRLFAGRNGLPEALVARWQARRILSWTPLQEAAWADGMMDSREDWLVGAPTSAGKGLLAEIVAARHLLEGERVVWLVPTRALAESLTATLAETFSALSLKVICATRERPQSDPLLASGRFDLCVAVPEKALAWLVAQPDGLAGVGLVIADELSLLRDAERGGRFDLLLTRIMHSPYAPRRLGLCLPVPNIAEVAAWWGGRLLVHDGRPRPLHEGIFESWSGRWRWRDRTSGEESSEELLPEPDLAKWRGRFDESLKEDGLSAGEIEIAAVAGALAGLGESTLLFAPTRPAARRLAELFIEAGGLKPCPEAVRSARRLARREPCMDHELLAQALACGVGLHHADLSADGRRIVEDALAADRLALVIATPTLAQGVNLSAINVLHWPTQVGEACGPDRPLSRWRFADQGGRAGRFGRGESAGRSILIATTPPRAEALWRRYILEPVEPLRSRLGAEDVACGVLISLSGGVSRTAENLSDELKACLAAHCGDSPDMDNALAACRNGGLISEDQEKIRLTGLGQATAVHGLTPAMVEVMRRWFDPSDRSDSSEPLPMLIGLALAAPRGLWPQRARMTRKFLLRELGGWFESRGLEAPAPLIEIWNDPRPDQLAAIEAAGRMLAWIGPEPTVQVEARTGWTAGMLARAGEGLAWLARAAAVLDPARAESWRALADRLSAGAPHGAESLADLRVDGLGRASLQKLIAGNLVGVKALAGSPLKRLGRLLGDLSLARRVREAACESLAREERGENVFAAETPAVGLKQTGDGLRVSGVGSKPRPTTPAIEIDLQSPGVVLVAGRELRLAPLGYDLLAALAERPGCVVTRAALYQKLWPDGGPEEQQLDAHRRRLSAALTEALGDEGNEAIEVVRGSGFRLKCEGVQLRRG